MVTPVILVLDEARDLGFEITGQVIVLEQNATHERLPVPNRYKST
jgi:hypothetical protein